MRTLASVLATLFLASCGLEGGGDSDDARRRDVRPTATEWVDPVGDLWAATTTDDGSFAPLEPRPASVNGDIRRVAVAHRTRSLEIKVEYAGLADVESMEPVVGELLTDSGLRREFYIAWDGRQGRAHPNVFTGDGGHVDCRAASAAIDFGRDTATLLIPHACLGAPRWVRVYVESATYTARPHEVHADTAMGEHFPATRHERTYTERIYVPPLPSSTEPDGRSGATAIVLHDPSGDVESIGSEADGFDDATPAPHQVHGDVVNTTVEHTTTHLEIRIDLVRLDEPDRALPGYRVSATVRTNAGAWFLEDELDGPPQLYTASGYEDVTCAGLHHVVSSDDGTVSLGIPRACLADPDWVRLELAVLTFQDNGATIDDAGAEGYRSISDANYTPRLSRP